MLIMVFGIISSTWSAGSGLVQGHDVYPAKPIVDEIKARLKDPNLSPEKRGELTELVTRIESENEIRLIKKDAALVGLNVVNFVGGLIGGTIVPVYGAPIGAGLAKCATHNLVKDLSRSEGKAQKARKIGGRRFAPPKQTHAHPMRTPSTHLPNRQSVQAGVQTGVVSYLTAPYVQGLKSWAWSLIGY